MHCRCRRGVSLVELLTALVLVALLTSLAVPSLHESLSVIRIRSTLDQLATELHYARLLAVREGYLVDVSMERDRRRCAIRYAVVSRAPSALPKRVDVAKQIPGLCLRGTKHSPLTFDSRGLARGSWQSYQIRHGGQTFAVVVSSAGRIRRDY